MDAHCSIELPHAFVLGEAELEKLTGLLSDRIGQVEIQANCADDVCRSFKNVRDLSGFENSRAKMIQSLRLSARCGDPPKWATIDLSGFRWRGISLEVRARDDVVSRLRTEVLEIIEGTRPWYALFQRVDFVLISLLGYVLLWFGSLLAVGMGWVSTANSKEDAHTSAVGQLVVFGGIAVLFASGMALNRFRDSVFPRAVFLIGQGKARFRTLEKVQWGVVMAFVVSVIAGVVVAVLQGAW